MSFLRQSLVLDGTSRAWNNLLMVVIEASKVGTKIPCTEVTRQALMFSNRTLVLIGPEDILIREGTLRVTLVRAFSNRSTISRISSQLINLKGVNNFNKLVEAVPDFLDTCRQYNHYTTKYQLVSTRKAINKRA